MKTAEKKQKSIKKARKATRDEEVCVENSKEESSSSKQQPDPKNSGSAVPRQQPQSFESFHDPRPLSRGVLQYVAAQNFTRMTPVQAATIPQFLSRKDVAVQAVTGSGKTLAFLIPIVETLIQITVSDQNRLKKKKHIGALILSPTRELAHQTYTVAKELFSYCQQPEPLLLVGGSSASGSASTTRPVTVDLQTFQKLGSTLVIGTPGRVQDVLTRYDAMDTSELECLVLDEADVLLNMGFATTLQDILSRLPKMRRTALFSATQSSSTTTNSSLKEWMNRVGMRNPIWIDVAVTSNTSDTQQDKSNDKATYKPQVTPSSLTNYYIVTKLDEKISRLYAFLKQHREEKVIVFFLTCCCVDFYGSAFQQLFPELSIELLHGKMNQKRREKTMERFRDDNATAMALFCTDVAARGLDVTAVRWVVQFDAPQDPAFFVHRVGRSARAGKKGNSLLFLTGKEEPYIDLLRMRNVPLQSLPTSEICCPPSDEKTTSTVKEIKQDDKVDSQEEKNQPATTRGARLIKSAADPEIILDNVLPKIRDIVMKDRDMLEKGTKAYTSYIRAYKENHCAFIFRFASLDLGLLATSFCLLRLPKMPELRESILRHNGSLPNFSPAGPEVDIFAIPFKDKAREQARQKRLQEELAAGGKNAKQINAERRKAEKEMREKLRRQAAKEKGRNPDKKRSRNAQIVDEWEDLAKEERLVKKLRKGKITKDEYEKQLYSVS